ncbi:MAG: tRNA (N6-threonylcarbamoyladenosine(37)-N6)-methyltransferase TrmO [Labilithrix sp.]
MDLVCRPIAYVRSPYKEKADAPRQGILAEDVTATIELGLEYRDALDDLSGFERVWVLFWFDRAEGWKPKVLPPRSDTKRGVFATRSPHRPNPIGMTAVRLDRVEGLTLHIRDHDLIDGTPVLDIKPYIAYADAFPDAASGWLGASDPKAEWEVDVNAVEEPLAWIEKEAGLDLRARVLASLKLGPQPHAYRRIKDRVLAVKEWRAAFRVEGQRIIVERVFSGFRENERPPLHEAFTERFR